MNRWFADLINIRDENRKLRQQVSELSWDEPFGMLTRPAFIQHCRKLPDQRRWIAFIDLNNIGELNLTHGYYEVDHMIRSVFVGFQGCQDIVARWYSGDEIVIVFANSRNPGPTMVELACKAREVGLTFVFHTGVWDSNYETIESAINELSRITGGMKYNLKLGNLEVRCGA